MDSHFLPAQITDSQTIGMEGETFGENSLTCHTTQREEGHSRGEATDSDIDKVGKVA